MHNISNIARRYRVPRTRCRCRDHRIVGRYGLFHSDGKRLIVEFTDGDIRYFSTDVKRRYAIRALRNSGGLVSAQPKGEYGFVAEIHPPAIRCALSIIGALASNAQSCRRRNRMADHIGAATAYAAAA